MKKNTAFCTTEKNQKFRRPKISFFGIFSYQVIVSGSKKDNFGAGKLRVQKFMICLYSYISL